MATAFGQAPGNSGGPPDIPEPLRVEKLSFMGRLAHKSVRGLLHGGRRTGAEADGDLNNVVGGQAETSIAVDTTGRHIVIAFNAAQGFALNPISTSGFKYSDDGGQTFTDGGPRIARRRSTALRKSTRHAPGLKRKRLVNRSTARYKTAPILHQEHANALLSDPSQIFTE
jgi:hypothetical protein